MDIDALFEIAKAAAKSAGQKISELEKEKEILSTEGKDIKTVADSASEDIILSAIKNTGIKILSEEAGWFSGTQTQDYLWVIDPLDGTYNFTRAFPMYCVSIALWKGNQPIFGVIYDIPHGALYSGLVGKGCYKDSSPINVGKTNEINQASILTGFPLGFDFAHPKAQDYFNRLSNFKKIRMIGAAAVSLTLVAEGVFDIYSEEGIRFWDVAAGAAMVVAAGGVIDYQFLEDGTTFDYFIATNSNLLGKYGNTGKDL